MDIDEIVEGVGAGELSAELAFLELARSKNQKTESVFDACWQEVVEDQVQVWAVVRHGNPPNHGMALTERKTAYRIIRKAFLSSLVVMERKWTTAGEKPTKEWKRCLSKRHSDGERNTLGTIVGHVATACCTTWGNGPCRE
jgi:hypothetical protein